MAIEKRTRIASIDVDPDTCSISVRFGLGMYEDGHRIGNEQWHRMLVEPGADLDKLIELNNQDITTREVLKAAPIETKHIGLLKTLRKAIEAYRAQTARAAKDET